MDVDPPAPAPPGYDAAFASPPRARAPAPSPHAGGDRFIPARSPGGGAPPSALDAAAAAAEPPRRAAEREEPGGAYNMLLRAELLGCPPGPASPDKALPPAGGAGSPVRSPARRVFSFGGGGAGGGLGGGLGAGAPAPPSPFSGGGDAGGAGAGAAAAALASPPRLPRRIPRAPFKVLDAPALADDFYLNLVDWSAQNVLAVGLGACVYLWSACTSKVTRLVDLGDAGGAVCSVAWSQRGSFLSVGTERGEVQVWDAAKCARVRAYAGHRQRVGCMAWGAHGALATGSRDRAILLRDARAPDAPAARLGAHRSEVCGLRWSPDGRELASGGNDNTLLVWDGAAPAAPALRFTQHTAAVKAIAWSPHQHGLLASGGGTQDRHIRFWSTATGAALQAVDTGSQVCNVAWSKNANELVSTHGYSQNQVCVWRYPSMARLAALTGHTMRVLYLAASPDGQTVVTGAGDETLRFWNVFPGPKAAGAAEAGIAASARTMIR